MKIIHLSDLHLGKKINEFSLLEDQKFILDRILTIIQNEDPDAILIAGDVYDRGTPSTEAVQLLDDFLTRLSHSRGETLLISGNHDSAERVAFGSKLMTESGVHIARPFNEKPDKIILTDSFGEVHFHLLPFIKKSDVRSLFPDEEIETVGDAVRIALREMNVDEKVRNVLVSHLFVDGGHLSDSEDTIGGIDSVAPSLFDSFDYVALGHLHRPQHVDRETIRYCGTPLKYSLSEVDYDKSVTVVEMGEKGTPPKIRTVPLVPMRDLRELKGPFESVISRQLDEGKNPEDFVMVVLTDEEDVLDAHTKLRQVYPNLIGISYDNTRTRSDSTITGHGTELKDRNPIDQFSEFFESQNGQPMSPEQRDIVQVTLEKLAEEERQ